LLIVVVVDAAVVGFVVAFVAGFLSSPNPIQTFWMRVIT
jgi:hypothetical protein